MTKTNINSVEYKNMIRNAAALLQKNKDYIDSLNVFPVPDGDTGTNMNLTMQSVIREIDSAPDEMLAVSKAIATGSLKGARGNSGVILSQILKGFSKETENVRVIDAEVLKKALQHANDLAAKAVMKPKEGTILTVCRELATAAGEKRTEDLVELLEYTLERGQRMLERTPDMLPVLKEAGVVDSGGQGLIVIMTGMLNFLKGVDVDIDFASASGQAAGESKVPKLEYDFSDEHISSPYSYCTEFLINGVEKKNAKEGLRKDLEKIGDCVLVVGDEDILKVHVHTDNPNTALGHALELGYLNDIKIENMDEQRKKTKKKKAVSPRKKNAMIAVSVGKGIDELFKQLLVDVIIEGGQSMNPSTGDLLQAIESVPSENVLLLPNNKNIILACQQAAKESGKNIEIIKTRSIPQGIGAAMVFNPEADLKENAAAMTAAADEVHSVQTTTAVRDSKVDGLEIKEGDFLGMIDGDIKTTGKTTDEAILNSLKDNGLEITDQAITIFYGQDVKDGDAAQLAEAIEKAYPEVEVDSEYGGQPIYPYILSVE